MLQYFKALLYRASQRCLHCELPSDRCEAANKLVGTVLQHKEVAKSHTDSVSHFGSKTEQPGTELNAEPLCSGSGTERHPARSARCCYAPIVAAMSFVAGSYLPKNVLCSGP